MNKIVIGIALALSLVSPKCEAQKEVTKVKKCPVFPGFPVLMPKPDAAKVLSKWFLIYHEGSNSLDTFLGHDNRKIDVGIVTADALAVIIETESRKAFLRDSERQALYTEKLKELSGKVMFVVRIFVAVGNFRQAYADPKNWAFVLLTEDDQRIGSASVKILDAGVVFDSDNYKSDRNNWHMVRLAVTFPNEDEKTGKPLVSETTKSITLGIGGEFVRLKAKFDFDASRK